MGVAHGIQTFWQKLIESNHNFDQIHSSATPLRGVPSLHGTYKVRWVFICGLRETPTFSHLSIIDSQFFWTFSESTIKAGVRSSVTFILFIRSPWKCQGRAKGIMGRQKEPGRGKYEQSSAVAVAVTGRPLLIFYDCSCMKFFPNPNPDG